jgi:hypothetical protein
MACPPDYPGWLAIFFLTTTPSSKGLALPPISTEFIVEADLPKKGA